MNKYVYCGPVVIFGVCVSNCWKAETVASSEKKAISNFKYQFKKQNNRNGNQKIELPGKVKLVS